MAKLLLVDDEPNVLYTLELGLAADELEIITALTGKEAIRLARGKRPDVAILDVRLPDMSGLDVFDALHTIDRRMPAIIVTAHSTTDTAIEATKRGAFDYLSKPVDLHKLREVVGRALDLRRMQSVPAVLDSSNPPPDADGDHMIGHCSAMQEIFKIIGRVTAQDVNVLITGESGTGKELAARAVFQHSRRADKPFLAMNCAAIPEGLLESELFGHVQGSFTGADRTRVGKFEQADGGTIFLDEIGDMARATQAKMLRLIQEQKFERIGSGESIQVDVRIISATNRNLEAMVADGSFRSDLLYRLNGFTIQLPPLRKRQGDLPLLVDYILRATSRKLGKSVHSITPEAMKLLEAHDWPGNVRELQGVLRYAVVQTVGEVIMADCLPRTFYPESSAPPGAAATCDVAALTQEMLNRGETNIYAQVTRQSDRAIIEAVLRHAAGNQVIASQLLGISRTTLRAKLQSLGMVIEKQVRP
ncbi:MAG TPA: sigma-54 dependent transcriptional regulator, partial [Urbifossiella sp.]